jgi:hypothetical protein
MPELPPTFEYLWRWFVQLHGKRDGGFGPERLKDREIEAWARLRQIKLKLFELHLLDRLDDIWMAAEHAKTERNKPTKGVRDEASVNDPKGIKRVLKSLAARANLMMKKKQTQ